MQGMHKMPDGSMMEDEEMVPGASIQAGALETMPDASIKSMERKLAASGAAAAQPKGGQTFEGLLAPGGEDYSEVETDEPDFEPF